MTLPPTRVVSLAKFRIYGATLPLTRGLQIAILRISGAPLALPSGLLLTHPLANAIRAPFSVRMSPGEANVAAADGAYASQVSLLSLAYSPLVF